MTPTTVSVVIVNFNGGRYLTDCLASLRQQTLPHSVLVVDNASSDGSARAAREMFREVSFVPLRHNVGFCRAVNIAARRIDASTSIMVTLNPDTRAEPDFLEQLVHPMASEAQIGSVAGTLVFERRPDIIASAGVQVHRNGVAIDARLGETRSSAKEPTHVFGASGGAAAYRLRAFNDVGGFCEPFFLYLEDVDLAWRLRLRGWDAVWAPQAVATHAYSAAAGEGSELKRRLLARNRIWTLARCLPGPIWARDWRSIVAFDAGAVGYAVLRRDAAALRGRAAGFARLAPRLLERTQIHRAASIEWTEIDRWIEPPISARRLLQLRALTGALARREDAQGGTARSRKVN